MPDRYIVFDVETPNSANRRMSAIGITVVEGEMAVEEFYSLVDPEVDFDYFNIALTGITPEMVAGQPTFPQLWEEIGPLMTSGLLVAHNAPFDMSVLAKCIWDYGVEAPDFLDYACTCQMSRRCYRNLPDHRLNTLCGYLDVDLSHHDARSDSNGCAQVLISCIDRGLDVERFRRTYDLKRCRTLPGRR